jgi:hypothetical protein
MNYSRILPLILILTACAPVKAIAPTIAALPSTEAATSTTSPTETLTVAPTSTPEPTATLTATPFPIPEGAVRTADGSTVFVKEGKLWQLDAQGQPAEKDILDIIFADVVDSGNIVSQLHPEYYTDDQKLLKDTLLPKGITINKRYKIRVDDFAVGSYKKTPGVHDVEAIGYMLDVSRVKWGEKSVAVMNFALVGADEPIPVVLGVMESDSQVTSLITRIYSARLGTDARGANDWSNQLPKEEPPSNLQSFADSYLRSIVEMDVFGYADPEKADEFYGWDYIKKNPDYSKIINDSVTHQMANTGWLTKQGQFKTAGEFLNKVIENSAKDPEKLGPGFVINNDLIVIFRDK